MAELKGALPGLRGTLESEVARILAEAGAEGFSEAADHGGAPYSCSNGRTCSHGRQIEDASPVFRRVRPATAENTGPLTSSSHCRQSYNVPSGLLYGASRAARHSVRHASRV